MGVVVSCDHILERDASIPILEEVVENLVPTQIFTLAHKEGQVLGPLEQFKISSSFLSNICEKKSDLLEKPYLINSAAKSLHVCCSTDLLFNVSLGLSQGIKKCDGVKQVTYLIDYPYLKKPGKFTKKLFWKYLQYSFANSLKNVNELWVASNALKEIVEPYYDGSIKVVRPFVNPMDYPLFPAGQFTKSTYMILSGGLTDERAVEIGHVFTSMKRDFRFVGQDDHLIEAKQRYGKENFIGWKCAGELAPILASAKGTIDFEDCPFPQMGLQSLLCGTPVITLKNTLKDEFYNNDSIPKLDEYSANEFEKKVVAFEMTYDKIDPKALRKHAEQFSQSTLQKKLTGLRIKYKKKEKIQKPPEGVTTL